MSLTSFAITELEHLLSSESEMDRMIGKCALEMVATFANQDHSGFSAAMCADIVNKLIRFQPLRPLTGEESEWVEVVDGTLWQNKRCSHVFKEKDGRPYDSEGIIFRENGQCYQSGESRIYIEFPYTPKTIYVDR